jgi:hypothetical protein
VPLQDNRALPWRPEPALLYTGQDRATADALAANLLPPPSATAANLLAVRSYLTQWNETSGGQGSAVPGEVLSLLGLTLGTSARVFAGLYIESALMREQVGGQAAGRGREPGRVILEARAGLGPATRAVVLVRL